MNRQDFRIKYAGVYKNLTKRGIKGKMYFLAILSLACMYAYDRMINGFYSPSVHRYFKSDLMKNEVFLIELFLFIILSIAVLLMNSISFVNSGKVRSYKRDFKNDLYSVVKNEIPEIVDYIYNQKIHPGIFRSSGLFGKYSDYFGDDWFKGCYHGVKFELCELHVFSLFKTVFSGFFVRCKLSNDIGFENHHFESLSEPLEKEILKFQNKYCSKVDVSKRNTDLYLAFDVKGYFLENKNKRMIHKINNDLDLLRSIVEIVKLEIKESLTAQQLNIRC